MKKNQMKTTPAMRAAALTLFRQQPELATREVARRVGMPPATAARIRHRAGLVAGPETALAAGPIVSSSAWVILPTGQVVLEATAQALQG